MSIFKRSVMNLPILYAPTNLNWESFSVLDKFGHAPDVDTACDIWELNRTYVFPSTVQTCYVSSTAAGDTSREITVEGLDGNWALQTEVINTHATDGRTFVQLTKQFIRVFRAYTSGAVATAGTIYISISNTDAGGDGIPDNLDNVLAAYDPTDQQTMQAIYTVPASYELFVTSYDCTILGGGTANAEIFLAVKEFGGVFRVKQVFGLDAGAGTLYSKIFTTALRVPQKSDIKLRVNSVSAVNQKISGQFEGLLVPYSP